MRAEAAGEGRRVARRRGEMAPPPGFSSALRGGEATPLPALTPPLPEMAPPLPGVRVGSGSDGAAEPRRRCPVLPAPPGAWRS